MRKVLLLITIIALASACNKEKDIKPQVANANASTASKEGDAGSDCVFNVTVCNGTFIFADQAEYDVVYNCLEQEYEKHNDDFEAQYANLNDDDFNAMADQTGFDEDATLLSFENSHSFVSYRQLLRDLEDAWLNNSILNPATDPDIMDYFDDPAANALVSNDGKYMIAHDLFIIDTNGDLWVFANAMCTDIPTVSNDPVALANNPNVIAVAGSGNLNDCKDFGIKREYPDYDGGQKQIKAKLRFHVGGSFGDPFTIAKAKMVSYKQKSNGKWRNFKTKLHVVSHGKWSEDCSNITNYFAEKTRRRNRLKVKEVEDNDAMYYKIGDVKGLYEVVNYSFIYNLSL